MTHVPRMQTRLAAKNQSLERPISNANTSASSASLTGQEDKQDRSCEANRVTFHKLKGINLLNKNTSIFNNERRRSKKAISAKVRFNLITLFSKMQLHFELTMETLILAIDILDKYMERVKDELPRGEAVDIALACFMMAMKYQEIYPPTLDQVQSRMNTYISFNQFVKIQIEVFRKLGSNLIMDSPIRYLKDLGVEVGEEKYSFLCMYLELAAYSPDIKDFYSWKEIMEAIKVFFMSRKQLEDQSRSKPSDRIHALVEKLLNQRGRLHQSYLWLSKKYSSARLHNIGTRSTTVYGRGFEAYRVKRSLSQNHREKDQ